MVKIVHGIASLATNSAVMAFPAFTLALPSIVMLFIVWQNRHHEALLTQDNNFKLTEKAILSLSKYYSDTVYHV